ncbi:MFS transporter [Candidatus Woesearchaeota archaeon]|nr:MFS transporter [Candidatus Woesearchaeota archaeon]
MTKINSSIKLLALSFFIIFFGYNGVQQYVTVFFAEKGMLSVGFYSLIIIYVLLSLCSPLAGAFVSKYGPKKAMVLASLFYALFILSLLPGSLSLVYLGSALLGIAAAFLWNGQNVYLIKASTENSAGKSAGLFMVALSSSAAAGILTIWYLQQSLSLATIFLIFSILPFVGFFLLLTLPSVPTEHVPNKFQLMKRSLTSPTAFRFSLLWFGLAFVSGLALGFLPIDIKNLFGIHLIGPLSTLFYVMPILFSYLFGKVSDKLGRKPMIILSFVLCGISLIILSLATTLWLMILGIIILTTYYAATRTITFVLVGDISSPQNLGSLTSQFWAVQNVGTVAALFTAIIIPGKNVYLVSLGFLVLSAVLLFPILNHSLPETRSIIEKEMGLVMENQNLEIKEQNLADIKQN